MAQIADPNPPDLMDVLTRDGSMEYQLPPDNQMSFYNSYDTFWQPQLPYDAQELRSDVLGNHSRAQLSSNIQTLFRFTEPQFPINAQMIPYQGIPEPQMFLCDDFDINEQSRLPTDVQPSSSHDAETGHQSGRSKKTKSASSSVINRASISQLRAPLRNSGMSNVWERLRPHIKRMYVDEDKTLREVMRIMASEHGLQGTVKMYKTRIKNWGLDKNNKEGDMQFVLHKMSHRSSIGKKSIFQVRGQTITSEEVRRYFRRKGGERKTLRLGALTPPYISYRSPSPVPRSPSPPLHLKTFELLFSSVKVYIDGSFSNGTWLAGDERDPCTSVKASDGVNTLLADFHTYCINADNFFIRGHPLTARRLLSKACNLVRFLLLSEHPECIDIMLHAVRTFIDPLEDIAAFMLKYISGMATEIFARSHPSHPMVEFWRQMASVGTENLASVIIQTCHCISDEFERNLGVFHHTTADVYGRFIEKAHADDYHLTEQLLRARIERYRDVMDGCDSRVLDLVYRNTWVCFYHDRNSEAEKLAMEVVKQAAESHETWYKIKGLGLAAMAQSQLRKLDLAENNLREAISLVVQDWGEEDPLALEYMVLLESWLRLWGRDADADKVWEEMDEIVGTDEVDEELRSQGQII